MILCLRCWLKENSYRIERNRSLADFAKFDIIEWQNAKVYGGYLQWTVRTRKRRIEPKA